MHLCPQCLEPSGRPLTPTSLPNVTTTTTMIAVWVGRQTGNDDCLLSEVNVRCSSSDLDLRVGLRAVVDGRGRHCDREEVCLVSGVKRLM